MAEGQLRRGLEDVYPPGPGAHFLVFNLNTEEDGTMGFFSWLFNLGEGTATGPGGKAVSCKELWEAAQEYVICEFAFSVCVDMIANAFGRVEFRTYRNKEEIREREHWLWNVEPNLNQNSTVFLRKLIDKLYRKNEALVVSFHHRSGVEMLAVADSWVQLEPQVTRMNEYQNVTVDGYTFEKHFREDDVLHLRLNQKDIRPVLENLGQSWAKMAYLAQKHYEWDQGQHWKVHVDQIAAGADGFEKDFAQMIRDQVKPFFDSPNAMLPEFDGYKYEEIGRSANSSRTSGTTDLRDLIADIFDFTSRGFLIPSVLTTGKVENTEDANSRFLTLVIDPLCDQLQEEINRKRYGYEDWIAGNYLRVDSSSIIHYDLFGQAANVEKLVGSGVYSINDLLRAVGQGTINEPWADKHYLTKNIAEMGAETAALGE